MHDFHDQLDAYDLYLRIKEGASSLSSEVIPSADQVLPALGHAVAGSIGTAWARLLTYPLDLVVTRIQVQTQSRAGGSGGQAETSTSVEKAGRLGRGRDGAGERNGYLGLSDVFRAIYATEGGVSAFFIGVVPDTVRSVADAFLFFLAYSFLRQAALRRRQRTRGALPVPEELLVGVVAGAFAKAFTTPLQNLVTVLQTSTERRGERQSRSGKTDGGGVVFPNHETADRAKDSSVGSIMRRIYAQNGLRGFWAGYSASLVLTLNPSLTFLLHRLLSRFLLRRRADGNPSPAATTGISALLTFLAAALGKAAASTLTYPFSLVKVRAQASRAMDKQDNLRAHNSSDAPIVSDQQTNSATDGSRVTTIPEQGRPSLSAPAMVLRIASDEGVAALYQGLAGEVLKGFLAHGITMLAKERIHSVVVGLYIVLRAQLAQTPPPAHLATLVTQKAAQVRQAHGEKIETAITAGQMSLQRGRKAVEDLPGKSKRVLDVRIAQVGDIFGSAKDRARGAVRKLQE